MVNLEVSSLEIVPSGLLQVREHSLSQNNTNENETVQLSLVIPTYNEGENISNIIELLVQMLDRIIPQEYELIVVDDNSPDKTWEIALNLANQYPQVRVMRRIEERGLSSAVIRGWQISRGQVLGVIDGDLQHPPEVLGKLLTAIDLGADLAVASRHVEGGGVSEWSVIRRFLSRGAQILGLVILPRVVGRISDPMSGYFMLRRQGIVDMILHPMGYKILLEVVGRGNIQHIKEVGYVFQERQGGESKVTWKQYFDYLLHLARLRSRGRISRLREKFPVGKFLRFGIVGFTGVFVDMAIFYLLSDPTTLAWGLTRSKIFSAEAAIVNNFLWNDRWTFGDISSRQKGWNKRIKRFLKFNLICLLGVAANLVILNLLFNVFGINRYIANLISIAIVTILNFWLNLKLSWRVTDVKKNTKNLAD